MVKAAGRSQCFQEALQIIAVGRQNDRRPILESDGRDACVDELRAGLPPEKLSNRAGMAEVQRDHVVGGADQFHAALSRRIAPDLGNDWRGEQDRCASLFSDRTRSPYFEDLQQADKIMGLIMRWNNELARTLLEAPDDFRPHVANPNGKINPAAAIVWALGYFEAVRLRFDDWRPLFESDQIRIFKPIVDLVECVPKRRVGTLNLAAASKPARRLVDSVLDVYDY